MAEENSSCQEVVSFLPGELFDLRNVFVEQLEAPILVNQFVVVDSLV
jgi:hypothetical protein